MSNAIEKIPDFSDGAEFIGRLHGRLDGRRKRQTRFAAAVSVIGALALFITSFNSIALHIEEDQWNSYLASETEDDQYIVELEADLAWEIYFNDLHFEEDLGQLIEHVLEIEGGEEILATIALKG